MTCLSLPMVVIGAGSVGLAGAGACCGAEPAAAATFAATIGLIRAGAPGAVRQGSVCV